MNYNGEQGALLFISLNISPMRVGAAHGYVCATQNEMSQCYTQFPEDTTMAGSSTTLSTRTSEQSTTTKSQDGSSETTSTANFPENENSYLALEVVLVIFAIMLV